MKHFALVASICLFPTLSSAADPNPAARAFYQYDAIHQPELSRTGMVSAQEGLAAQVGADILRRGGTFSLFGASPRIKRLMRLHGVEEFLSES